jgi:hypothetical protein
LVVEFVGGKSRSTQLLLLDFLVSFEGNRASWVNNLLGNQEKNLALIL